MNFSKNKTRDSRFSALLENSSVRNKSSSNANSMHANSMQFGVSYKNNKQKVLDVSDVEQFPTLTHNVLASTEPSASAESRASAEPRANWASLVGKQSNDSTIMLNYRTDGSGKTVPINAPETTYERQVRLLSERKEQHLAFQSHNQRQLLHRNQRSNELEDYYSQDQYQDQDNSDADSVHEYVEEIVNASDYDDEN
jgi:hypothetical protein